MTAILPFRVAPRSAAALGGSLAILVLSGTCDPALAQGAGDRAAHRAHREHQQLRQQMRAEKERRLTQAMPAPPSQAEPPAPRQLSLQERMQLREQLRQASRQRQPVSEQVAP